MLIELPLSRYDFEYSAQHSVRLPNQSGSIWHSVLGKTLKELSCVVEGGDCVHCLLAQQCDYTRLFKGVRPRNSKIMRKYTTVPSPHILQTVLTERMEYQPGDLINIGLVLCGRANEKLPLLARALSVAGLNGLGKKRAKLRLNQITQFTGSNQSKFLLQERQLGQPLLSECSPIPDCPKVVQLTFLTPYKPSGKAGNARGVDFGLLLMAIIRRVSLLQYFSTGAILDADFKALKALTEAIKVLDVDLDFHRSRRYSAHEDKEKSTSGFMGTVVFDLKDCEALWPFMVVGQWLNVGKNASMGFGRYTVGEIYDNISYKFQ